MDKHVYDLAGGVINTGRFSAATGTASQTLVAAVAGKRIVPAWILVWVTTGTALDQRSVTVKNGAGDTLEELKVSTYTTPNVVNLINRSLSFCKTNEALTVAHETGTSVIIGISLGYYLIDG